MGLLSQCKFLSASDHPVRDEALTSIGPILANLTYKLDAFGVFEYDPPDRVYDFWPMIVVGVLLCDCSYSIPPCIIPRHDHEGKLGLFSHDTPSR